jgi:hypothetical protein
MNPKFSFLYNLDLRAIAAYRIVLALVLIIDFFVYRLPSRIALYSNEGFISANTAMEYPDSSPFSLLYYITSPQMVLVFFMLYFLLCVALLIGYKTSVVCVVTYIFYYSIQERVAPFMYGGDDALRIALFWAMFLPLNKRFSIFTNAKTETSDHHYSGIAAFAVLLQISLIYFFNAALKTGETWGDGTAVAYAASIFEHQAKFSYIMIENEGLSKLLTFCTKFFEYCVPLLVFSPFFNNKTRITAALLIISFHFGLIPFLNVNTFYLSTLPFAIILLPPSFWDSLTKKKGNA